MFTVILLRGRAKGAFAQAKTLFEPFEEEGLLTFVDWNESPHARTIDDALPGIRPVIKGKREWRVVVVDNPDENDLEKAQPDNPFDYVDSEADEAIRLSLKESEHPLVRLAHMLLGYPPIGAKDFEAVYSYKDPDDLMADRVERRAADLAEDGEPVPLPSEVRTMLSGVHDLKIHYREMEYTAEERTRHNELAKRYEFRGNRPTEVIFISTRRPPEDDPHAQLRAAWSADLGRVTSQFVARNDYPSGTRFALYDLVDEQHSDYEQSIMRFWLSVLNMSVNDLPPSSFQSDRVYRIDTEVDTTALVATMNVHLSRLAAIRDRIDAIFRGPGRRPSTELSSLLAAEEVPVEFDQLGGDSITAPTNHYSLATDTPYSESSRWWGDYRRVVERTETLLRKPRRVLAAAVYDARLKAQFLPSSEIELTRYEREDLEDDLSRQIGALAAPATAHLLDRPVVRRMIERHHRSILKTITKRLHSNTIFVAGGIAAGAWILGLVPYLIAAGTAGVAPALGDAALVAVAGLAILLAGAVLVLLWQRRRLLAAIGDLNHELKAIRGQVHGGAAVFGAYLTAVASYMRARSLLIGSAVREDRERTRRLELDQLKLRINRAMVFERGLIQSLGATPVVRNIEGDLHGFDLGNGRRTRRLLQLPSPTGLLVPLNTSGEQITAPYDFVSRLIVERVPLFERPHPVAGDEATE